MKSSLTETYFIERCTHKQNSCFKEIVTEWQLKYSYMLGVFLEDKDTAEIQQKWNKALSLPEWSK